MIKLPQCFINLYFLLIVVADRSVDCQSLPQILFAFVSAVVKMQISKRSQLTAEATYSSGNSSNNFDASQYMVGQLLKEMFLDLGPTFVKGRIVMLNSLQDGSNMAWKAFDTCPFSYMQLDNPFLQDRIS